MRGLLSYARALYQMYQNFHWKTSGEQFYGDHLLFERLYGDMEDELDQLAEKLMGTDQGLDPVTDGEAAAKMLAGMTSNDSGASDFPEEAIRAEEVFLELITKTVEDGVSDGTEDLLQGVANKHEEHLYLLKQRNKTAASKSKKKPKSQKKQRPPKKWWNKMEKEIKKGNPDYDEERISATIGDIWFHNLKEKKRKQISKRDRKSTMLIELFKLAHTLDKKAEFELANDVDEAIKELIQRAGLELRDVAAAANYLDEHGLHEAANYLDGVMRKNALINMNELYEVEKQIIDKEGKWPYPWRVAQLTGRIRGIESKLMQLKDDVEAYRTVLVDFRDFMDSIDAFQAQQELNKFIKRIPVRNPIEFVNSIVHFLVGDLRRKHGLEIDDYSSAEGLFKQER